MLQLPEPQWSPRPQSSPYFDAKAADAEGCTEQDRDRNEGFEMTFEVYKRLSQK